MADKEDEKPGAAKALRATQVAMLSFVAVAFLLTSKPVAVQRLEAASTEIDRWPSEKRIAKALAEAREDKAGAYASVAFGLPKQRLTPRWIDESLSADGRLLVTRVTVEQEAAIEKDWEGVCNLLEVERSPAGNGQARGVKQGAQPDGGCNVGKILLVADAIDTSLRTRAKEAFQEYGIALAALAATKQEMSAACGRMVSERDLYGDSVASFAEFSQRCRTAHGKRSKATNDEGRRWADVEGIRLEVATRSDELQHKVASAAGGSDAVVELWAKGARRYVAAGANGLRKDLCAISNKSEIVATCPCDGNCKLLDARPSVTFDGCENLPSASSGWSMDRITCSGAWNDIKDLDLTSAQAALFDLTAKSQLKSEVIGIEFAAKDARRSLWLPIIALAIYGIWLWIRIHRSKQPSVDWPIGLPAQLLFLAIAILGIFYSRH